MARFLAARCMAWGLILVAMSQIVSGSVDNDRAMPSARPSMAAKISRACATVISSGTGMPPFTTSPIKSAPASTVSTAFLTVVKL